VLGRNARTKSHDNLPPEKRYVDVYILVTSSKDGHLYDRDNYEDLVSAELSSSYFGLFSREEVEYYNKFVRYRQIQQYERMLHQVAIDPEIYGKQYFIQQSNEDGL